MILVLGVGTGPVTSAWKLSTLHDLESRRRSGLGFLFEGKILVGFRGVGGGSEGPSEAKITRQCSAW